MAISYNHFDRAEELTITAFQISFQVTFCFTSPVSPPTLLCITLQVLGGLVWILAASVRVIPSNPLGWVMFVSIFCFVMTTLWFFIFLFKGNKKPIWVLLVRYVLIIPDNVDTIVIMLERLIDNYN